MYLKVLNVASVTVKNGTSPLLNVQYHVANVAAKTISASADTKNNDQKKPTTLIATTLLH